MGLKRVQKLCKKIGEIHAIMILWKKAPGPRKNPGAFAILNSALETRLPRDLGEGPALGAYWLPEPPGNPGRPEGASAENKAGWGLALVDPPAGGGVQVPACPMSTAARRRDTRGRASFCPALADGGNSLPPIYARMAMTTGSWMMISPVSSPYS